MPRMWAARWRRTKMKMGEALDIVYQLAEQNVLEVGGSDKDGLLKMARKQRRALDMVHDLIVNEYEENEEGPDDGA